MRRRRLLWQIYPSYLLITLLTLVAVTWYASHSLRKFYLTQAAQDLEARVRLIRNEIPKPLEPASHEFIDGLAKSLGRESGTRITVILPDGIVIADSDENPARMENHADRPEIIDAYAGRVGSSVRYSATINTNMMYVAIPLVEGRPGTGVIRGALPLSAIDRTLRDTYMQIALGGLIVALFVAGLSLIISRRLSRPLEELKLAADRFAAGDSQVRFPVPESEEIGGLAQAMNKMIAQIDERVRDLIRQRNEQQAVLASMVEGVLAIDSDEHIISVNQAAARLFGIDRAELEDRRLQEAIRNPELHSFAATALDSEEPIEGELSLDSPDRWIQVHATSLRDHDGHRIGVLLVLNDITKIRRLERIRRDFVANVSHELKTPITAIGGFVETLQGGAMASKTEAQRFLGIIARHSERLNSIIEDLLTLSRIEQESEGSHIDLRNHNIHDVLRSAIEMCSVTANAKGVQVKLVGDGALSTEVNVPLLEQAVVNLIDNAIKYSTTRGTVEVAAEGTGDRVVIHVRDRGVGIEPEHLPRLFERFYRVDRARSRQLGGTGLGLAIVKHIAIAHGGTVDVKSEPGAGSDFSIVLPLRTSPEALSDAG